MKKLLFTALLSVSVFASAQYVLPAASPRTKIEQQFSLSKITVDYGRPGVKGRKVFGELVPYGQVWRAGANSSTKITFGQNVTFGGKPVAAGTYGLFIEPAEKNWKIILNKDAQQWGAYEYDASKNVVDIMVPVQPLAQVQEWFEISLNPVDEHGAELIFEWDRVRATVPVRADQMEKTKRMADKLKEIRAIEREK